MSVQAVTGATGTAAILPGPYRTPAYAWEAVAVRTHKSPLGPYRGVGMTMGAFVMERLLDLLAARLALDPAEVRRRNLIPRDAYPFTSASGMTYDSGDFPKALEAAKTAKSYRCFFDFADMIRTNKDGYFPYTPATTLLRGLRASIDMLLGEGLENVFARHQPDKAGMPVLVVQHDHGVFIETER